MFGELVEIKLSTENMDCEYTSYNSSAFGTNFLYPKLYLEDDQNAYVFFIDKKKKDLVVSRVDTGSSEILKTNYVLMNINFPRFWQQYWPVIYRDNNRIFHIFHFNELEPKTINLYEIQPVSYALTLKKTLTIPNSQTRKGDSKLWDVFPLGNELFFFIGHYIKKYFHFDFFVSGHSPENTKFFSFLWDGAKVSQFDEFDKPGRFRTIRTSLLCSSEAIHAAWIRSNIGENRSLNGQTETICYRKYDLKKGWDDLLELYTFAAPEYKFINFNDLFVTGNDMKVYLTWQDRFNNLFLSDLYSIQKINMASIGNEPDQGDYDISIDVNLPHTRITLDDHGNIYILLVKNKSRRDTESFEMNLIFFNSSDVVHVKPLLHGEGHVTFPDIAVDRSGNIHMAYIRTIGQGSKFSSSCYYAKLSKLDPR